MINSISLIKNKSLNFKSNLSFFVTFVLSLAFIAMFFVTRNATLTNVFCASYIVFLLLVDDKASLCGVLLTLPANEILKFSNGTTFVTIYFIAYSAKKIIFSFIAREKGIEFNCFFYSSLALLLLIPFFYIFGNTNYVTSLVKHICCLIYIGIVLKENLKNNELISIYRMSFVVLAIGFVFTSILGIMRYGVPSFSYINYRWSYTGDDDDANMIAIIGAIIVSNLLYDLLFLNGKKKLIKIVLIVLCSAFSLFTLSRSFPIAVIAFCFFALLFSIRKNNFFVVAFLLIGLIALAAILIRTVPIISNAYKMFASRFNTDDITSGRLFIWSVVSREMTNSMRNMLFGLPNYGGVILNDDLVVAHNFLIETWASFGLIGSLLFSVNYFAFSKMVFVDTKRISTRKRSYMFIPLIVFLIVFFFSHHFIGRINTLLLILCVAPIFMSRIDGPKVAIIANK